MVDAGWRELSDVVTGEMAVRDPEGRVMLQVAQIATVYLADGHTREAREKVLAVCEGYFARWGQHLRWARNPDTDQFEPFGAGKGSNPRSWAPVDDEESTMDLAYSGAAYEKGAGAYMLSALCQEYRPRLTLSPLKLALPLIADEEAWGVLPEVLLEVCRALKPVSGYGGIGAVDSPFFMESYQYGSIVYHWAQRFPGMEVEYTFSHANWMTDGREGKKDGIKGVNWLTVVGDRYLAELGGAEEVAAAVEALDARFVVHRYEGGMMIQAGPRPQLGDARQGVWPELYVKLAKLLKPIRIVHTNPFHRGGPAILFTKEESEAWLRRFDDR